MQAQGQSLYHDERSCTAAGIEVHRQMVDAACTCDNMLPKFAGRKSSYDLSGLIVSTVLGVGAHQPG